MKEVRGRIVILGGGPSAEREVSLRSAAAVYEALRGRGDVALMTLEGYALPEGLNPETDIVFLTTHGTFGEDGELQALLDSRGFAYTGADAASSKLCFDKQRSRHLAEGMGIAIAEGMLFQSPPQAKELWKAFGPKMVLKPNAQGSSVGLHIVESQEQLQKVLEGLDGTPMLVEKFVEGRELTVGILNGKALGVVEIIPQGGVYDYARKYTAGQTRYEFPAKLPEAVTLRVRAEAEKIFSASGCRDFARVDFRLDEEETPVFLEINTLPGLTATSLLPKSAACLGLDFAKLVGEMLHGACARYASQRALAVM